jgi:hypothetical protein
LPLTDSAERGALESSVAADGIVEAGGVQAVVGVPSGGVDGGGAVGPDGSSSGVDDGTGQGGRAGGGCDVADGGVAGIAG